MLKADNRKTELTRQTSAVFHNFCLDDHETFAQSTNYIFKKFILIQLKPLVIII